MAMDSVKNAQVGVDLQHPPIGPLSHWERVRVRGFSQALVNVPAIAALFDQAFDFGAAEDIVEGLVDA
ncbi:hypothetical protein SRABI89_05451 [Pseudomonas koreensis]|nr:hypothetical protein SRABI89_05451 [Pseudomonas koreensis]